MAFDPQGATDRPLGPDIRASIADLLVDALSQLDHDRDLARARIEQAVSLAGGEIRPIFKTGGLAPWQVAKIKAHVEENLCTPLRIEPAAAAARLSASYFSRAFKATFGQPFSQYVIHQRIERAKALLHHTDQPICDVALACGLSDQSHLSRLFHRAVGTAPAAWRRAVRQTDAAARTAAIGRHAGG